MSGPVIERVREDGLVQSQSAVGSFRLGAGLAWAWDDDDVPLLSMSIDEQDDPEDVTVEFNAIAFGNAITYANLPTGSGTWATGANETVTLQGQLVTSASTTTRAGLLISPGAAPTGGGLVDGAVWLVNATGWFGRRNGTTEQFAVGIIGPTQGGTGLTSYTTGDLIYASATNALAKLAASATASGPILRQTSGVPAWTTATYPSTSTAGAIMYAAGTNTWNNLTGFSSTNQLLLHDGSAPAWVANLPYARMPTGNGSWDVGSGNTLTITRRAEFSDGIKVTGAYGFSGVTPANAPTVTGSRGGNAALADLLTKLAARGLIVDGTSA